MDLTIIILLILGGVVVILVSAFLYLAIVYKHRVVLRELARGRKIIKFDKARDYVDGDTGVRYWCLFKENDKERRIIPVPPKEAIELTAKGKKWVEAYRSETGEVNYIVDNTTDMGDIMKFQPLTTNQRFTLVTKIKQAQSRKRRKLSEYMPMIVSIGALVILVVSLMIFWGDMAKPIITTKAQMIRTIELENQQVRIMQDILRGVQTVESEQDALTQRVDGLEGKAPD